MTDSLVAEGGFRWERCSKTKKGGGVGEGRLIEDERDGFQGAGRVSLSPLYRMTCCAYHLPLVAYVPCVRWCPCGRVQAFWCPTEFVLRGGVCILALDDHLSRLTLTPPSKHPLLLLMPCSASHSATSVILTSGPCPNRASCKGEGAGIRPSQPIDAGKSTGHSFTFSTRSTLFRRVRFSHVVLLPRPS